MTEPPQYFERIRIDAAECWDQLEARPDRAGPWHQLFKQVQNPRHILSELLQNADDAGATEASVHIEEGVFIFEHNGEDFTEEHFASICRFGYSNKRVLHTIGFRGIGFKCVFSLGDQVEVHTPTLSVSFNKRRFTEPIWLGDQLRSDGLTSIRASISDHRCQLAVEKNLEEWLENPLSFLFFNHIRSMQIADRQVFWDDLGTGPVPQSRWMKCGGHHEDRFLLVRSEPVVFPDEAMTEILEEQTCPEGDRTDFPPCRIDIVLGAEGRMFVVLPTGVKTTLPFACNAPFIQDPARLEIRNPETSPTNRWLLEAVGELAASSMLGWVNRADIPAEERAGAYGLMPDVDRQDNSLEGVCGTIVEKAFAKRIEGQQLLLTHDGEVVSAEECVIIPEGVFDVWQAEEATALLDEKRRPALSRHVRAADRAKLLRWNLVEEFGKKALLHALQSRDVPKPKTWRQLLRLWAYVGPEFKWHWQADSAKKLWIVPVQGKEVLCAAEDVVRIGEKKLLHSEQDWEFLASHLMVLNQNWTRFLADQKRKAQAGDDRAASEAVGAACDLLRTVDLENASDVSTVIDRVAQRFFDKDSPDLEGAVLLARIAATLDAGVGDEFRYFTRDGSLKSVTEHILDVFGEFQDLMPDAYLDVHLLHPAYADRLSKRNREEWNKWVSKGRAALAQFPPLEETSCESNSCKSFELHLRSLGDFDKPDYPYVTKRVYSYQKYIVKDFDFPAVIVEHWEKLPEKRRVWASVANHLQRADTSYWQGKTTVVGKQTSSGGGSPSQVKIKEIPAAWLRRLRSAECLPDTHGIYHLPSDLFRRTPETEALVEIGPFIDLHLDCAATQPLLDLLGVQSAPTGPDRLLDCLRALSKMEKPPIRDVEKWYRRLDQMVDTCSTTDVHDIKQALQSEKLILTDRGFWATSSAVFVSCNEEDAPGIEVIRPSLKELTLWAKIGVAERPTADLAIRWLKGLSSGQRLPQDDLRRVRALLVRYPVPIWEQCHCWLNLAGELVQVQDLSYKLTTQSLIPWEHLLEWAKQKTADLRFLPAEIAADALFLGLSALADRLEDHITLEHHINRAAVGGIRPERKEWLNTLGDELCRIELEEELETNRVRALASDLAHTGLQMVRGLEVIPYIDGTPAGTPRRAKVVWLERVLYYVEELSTAKLAKCVPEEIGNAFNQSDIKAALDYSFERSPDDIRAYLEENFNLASRLGMAGADGKGTEASLREDEAIAENRDELQGGRDGVAADAASQSSGKVCKAVLLEASAEENPLEYSDEPGGVTPAHVTKASRQSQREAKPLKPSMIERFAHANGFRRDGDNGFIREDKSWIRRTRNECFPWERRTASGDLVCYYWAKEHCLQFEPLQIGADMWRLIEESPEEYALVLSDHQGAPIEMGGVRLRKLKEEGKLKLYPATYRLAMEDDQHA